MDRFNGRENVLLGVTPQTQRVFHSASSSSQGIVSPRNSDIDFNDVFGGPPRRFSTQETRYSFGEAVDSCGQEDDDKAVSLRPWSSSTEKPVFGDENVNRRRYQTGDFFDDIFRGDESSYSSPRRTERDLLSSAPGSRISSPARSLPPKIEPFGTSLPAQISLPAKLSKAGDFPLFASGKGESYSLSLGASSPSRFSSQGHDIRPRHRQSPLSNEYSHSGEESINMIKSDERDLRRKSTEDFKVMDIQDNCNQFHFSIYKWAGRGVPLLMPFRGVTSSKSKEKAKIKRCSSSNERIVSHGVVSEVPISGIHDTDKLTIQGEKKENASTRARENRRQTVEEAVSAMPDFKSIVENVLGNASFSNRREKIKPLPEKEVSSIDQEALKPERMPQTSLLNDEIKEKGENRPELNKASFQGSSMEAGDIHVRSRVKSKVKDFVKIFNQEASSSEPKIKAKTGSQSFRWKGTTNAANREESFSTTKMDKEVHTPFSMEDKNIESEKQNFRGKSTVDTISDDFSGQNDAPSFGESFPDGSGVGNADNTFQANFLIRELSPDMDKVVQTGEDYEDFHVLDAKIKKWSNGKKGNIRSLLSTLQYVLWAESGWKPVPLVSIVEGNGVKRAYQKALLCLHPDKLQQKSAASHQKYIAEKVFDILQEAWEQFNSLDSPF